MCSLKFHEYVNIQILTATFWHSLFITCDAIFHRYPLRNKCVHYVLHMVKLISLFHPSYFMRGILPKFLVQSTLIHRTPVPHSIFAKSLLTILPAIIMIITKVNQSSEIIIQMQMIYSRPYPIVLITLEMKYIG